jgi:hypothetical protein
LKLCASNNAKQAAAEEVDQHRFSTRMSALVCVALCSALAVASAVAAGGSEPEQAAETFVRLTLRLGAMRGREEEVDSYFGPQTLHPAVQDDPGGLVQLRADADALLSRMEIEDAARPTPRASRLLAQVRSFDLLLQFTGPAARAKSFEDEAQGLYGRSVPRLEAGATHQVIAALEAALPGPGPLSQRLAAFYGDFIVPADRRRVVFERALRECRSRTLAHWQLPRAEKLDVEWTDSIPAAWHRYRGGWRSTLQINPGAVALAGSAIDVACHEAYPGHHAQFLLQDQRAQPAGLPVEERVVLLRSPASVLREGAANYGIELAFPFDERVAFDERVLFPLAHLDPRQARRYETVHRLVDQLSAVAAPIIASYRDHRLSSDDAELELANEALVTSPSALLKFADQYGAYVLGYTAVRDSVRDYVKARSHVTGRDDWSVLRELVSDPYSVRDLQSSDGTSVNRAPRGY